jgi:hypothetical protein
MYDNKRKVVLSLYDFTGEALKPWADRLAMNAMRLIYSMMIRWLRAYEGWWIYSLSPR